MGNRNLKKSNTSITKIYDDILKFYFAQGYLDKIGFDVRKLFVAEDWKAKLINYLTPFVKFAKRYFEYKKVFQPHFTKENLEGKTWLFVSSLNNRNSLKFLLQELENTVLVGSGIPIEISDKYQIPFHRTVLFIWKFPKIYRFFKQRYGKEISKYGDLIFRSVGLYEVAFATLANYRPKCLVLANDHSEKQRALLNAAKRLNIPVVYIQHASISDFMPPLDFDLSLLEGQAALDKYKSLGTINGMVQLIGMPKFDDYIQFRNYSKTVQNIGICTNVFDKAADIYKMIEVIQQKLPQINISLRPHPGYKRKLTPPKNVSLSTKTEHIFDFLKHQDLLIAGNSSVHLEAISLNVTSVYYSISEISQNAHDPYGYIKNGLLEEFKEINALIDFIQKNIKNRKPVFQMVEYYNAIIGTKNEGQSKILAAKYIKDFLEKWDV